MLSKPTFETLLKKQVTALKKMNPKDFNTVVQTQVKEALEWFDLCRLAMYPNSVLMLNEGKSITVARDEALALDIASYVSLGLTNYLDMLKKKTSQHYFDRNALKTSKINILNQLYSENAQQHLLTRMELFGQKWGAISVTSFNQSRAPLSQQETEQLLLLCDTWLVYWQHSAVTRRYDETSCMTDDSEKLLKLRDRKSVV